MTFIRIGLFGSILVSIYCQVPPQQPMSNAAAELPGPSAALHAAPFYKCLRNFYVAPNGDDENPGTETKPWLTIQRADTPSRTGGDCINVEPGTYMARVIINHGGTEPTPTGYVVYRCQALNACHILAPGGGYLWGFSKGGNFVLVDGFEVDGNSTLLTHGVASACFGTGDETFGTGNSAHHIWIINNIIHDCNLSGIVLAWKEWYYVIHNTVYGNSYTSGYQGSGISFVVLQCIEVGNTLCYPDSIYTPSGMDITFMVPFHNVVSWNLVYDNMIGSTNPVGCGNHTDGNGIIMDTFFDGATNTIPYPYRTLVFSNISHSNGGRGIHVFKASNITVGHNTVFGNGRDTCIKAVGLGDLSQAGGSDNIWINNISKSILTPNNFSCGDCGGNNAPIVAGDGGGVIDKNISWFNNLTHGGRGVMLFDNDANVPYFSCHRNRCNTDPNLVNPTSGNFALRPGSPAVGHGGLQHQVGPLRRDLGACEGILVSCP